VADLTFYLTEGDSHPTIEFQLLRPSDDPEAGADDFDLPDLTAATVFLRYRVGATVYERMCEVRDAGKAICRYGWTPADLAVLVGPTTYKAKVRAQWSDGSKLTFPNKKGEYLNLVVDGDL
jgi:hypothetical protein